MIKPDLNNLVALLLILFFLICAASFLKPRFFAGRSFSLFRVLFPSWRFFEDLGPVAKLYYRTWKAGESSDNWISCLKPQSRGLKEIFFNPDGNLQMASHSLIEQALLDINEQDPNSGTDFSSTVSYRLLKNLVKSQIPKQASGNIHFQFQIQVSQPDGEIYQALLSEEHEA